MQTPMAPQKRHLTLLFSDLSQSMRLSQNLDYEILAEVIGRVQEAFVSIIPRFGGVVSQVQGDGVYAVFGLEYEEDAGRRAVEAGLALHEAVRRLDLSYLSTKIGRLKLHSGVHSGLTHVTGGDEIVGTVSVMADAVNVAHRLAAAAGPDEILVSEISLGADRHFFEADALRSVELRGVPDPIAAYPIRGKRSLPSRFHSRLERSGRLIGREAELDALTEGYRSADRGEPQVISIVAPPGSGKTRLAETFLSTLPRSDDRAPIVLRGYCEALSGPRSAPALVQMGAQLLGIGRDLPDWVFAADAEHVAEQRLRDISEHLAEHARPLVTLLRARAQGESDTAASLIEVARAIARERLLVLFIDDWQWADDLTRSVLRPIRSFDAGRLLLLRTIRDPSQPSPGERVIQLGPLVGSQSGALIEDLAPDVGPFVVREIQAASGGNPLFIEELCHAVRHGRSLTDITRGREVAIYNSLHMLIEARVAELDPSLARVLKDLSVLGDGAPWWLVDEVLEEFSGPDLDAALERLSESDFVYAQAEGETDRTLRFKHGIAKDVVYSLTTIGTRLRVHQRAVDALEAKFGVSEREVVAERLAYHSAGTAAFQQTADYAELAGNKAMNAAIMDLSRVHFERALDALEKQLEAGSDPDAVDQWVRICRRYAQACLFDTKPEQLRYFEIGARLGIEIDDQEIVADMHYWLASLNYTLGDNRHALRHVEIALNASDEQLRPLMNLQLKSVRGQIRVMQCEHELATRDLDEALAAQRRQRQRATVSYPYGYGLAVKGMSLGHRGQFIEANAHFALADEVLGEALHQIQASVVTMHAGSLLWQGEWAQALERAKQGIWLADRLASRYMMASSSALAAYARWSLGEADALAQMDTAIATARDGREVLWMSMHFSWYAEMLMAAGRVQEARAALSWSLIRSRQGEHLSAVATQCLLAALHDPERRADDLNRADSMADRSGSPRERLQVASARLALGVSPTLDREAIALAYDDLGMPGHAARIRSH